jgi:hypothetical protein
MQQKFGIDQPVAGIQIGIRRPIEFVVELGCPPDEGFGCVDGWSLAVLEESCESAYLGPGPGSALGRLSER